MSSGVKLQPIPEGLGGGMITWEISQINPNGRFEHETGWPFGMCPKFVFIINEKLM